MNPLTRKLENFAPLLDRDRKYLDDIIKEVRHVPARIDIITEGDAPSDVHLILKGFACRNKVTPDGDRQILAYMVPGDFCDLHVAVLGQMDHSISTLSDCDIVDISIKTIEEMTARPNWRAPCGGPPWSMKAPSVNGLSIWVREKLKKSSLTSFASY